MPSSILLASAVDRYLGALAGAGYSQHTLAAYSTRLNDFARFTGDAPIAEVGPDAIQAYLADLRIRRIGRRQGVSAATSAHAYAVLSGFFRYAERVLRVEPNPIRDVLRPRTDTSVDDEFKSLTATQLHDLLRAAREGWPASHGPRDMRSTNRRIEDYLIIGLMGLAGLRVSEVCGLDRRDADGDSLTVLGKGRKRRTIPLVSDLTDALREYSPPSPGPHLFGLPRDPARRITPGAVEQRVPRLARRAGIFDLRVTPHTLRHTFGSLMLGADPNALVPTRDLMGHASIETTNKYAHTREADRRLALASFEEARRRARP